MRIKPFKALRPPDVLAAEVASLPYDVGELEDARKIAVANPKSFLHVERPEVDLPDSFAAGKKKPVGWGQTAKRAPAHRLLVAMVVRRLPEASLPHPTATKRENVSVSVARRIRPPPSGRGFWLKRRRIAPFRFDSAQSRIFPASD